jgi:hypothetical protein
MKARITTIIKAKINALTIQLITPNGLDRLRIDWIKQTKDQTKIINIDIQTSKMKVNLVDFRKVAVFFHSGLVINGLYLV